MRLNQKLSTEGNIAKKNPPSFYIVSFLFFLKTIHQCFHHMISVSPFLPALFSSVVAVEMLVETTLGLDVVTVAGDVRSVDVGEGRGWTREEASRSTTVTARPASLSPSMHQYQPDWLGSTPWKRLKKETRWNLVPKGRNTVDCQIESWQQSLADLEQVPTATGPWLWRGGRQGRMQGDRRASEVGRPSPSCCSGTRPPRMLPPPGQQQQSGFQKVTFKMNFAQIFWLVTN